MVKYRYELKYVISRQSAELLKRQLKLVMPMDSHSISEEYSYDIRSLYFDDFNSTAFSEKVDGVEFRHKYRIRLYNKSDKVINLECKHKDADMTYKESCTLTRRQTEHLINGDYRKLSGKKKELLQKFIAESRIRNLRPSVIVDYRRTAFTYVTSEVRITFDEDITSGRYNTDIFDFETTGLPVYQNESCVLEVKCNEFIPEHIILIINSVLKERQAVSKFALCRSVK